MKRPRSYTTEAHGVNMNSTNFQSIFLLFAGSFSAQSERNTLPIDTSVQHLCNRSRKGNIQGRTEQLSSGLKRLKTTILNFVTELKVLKTALSFYNITKIHCKISLSVRSIQVLGDKSAPCRCPRPLHRGVHWIQVHVTVGVRSIWGPLNTGF